MAHPHMCRLQVPLSLEILHWLMSPSRPPLRPPLRLPSRPPIQPPSLIPTVKMCQIGTHTRGLPDEGSAQCLDCDKPLCAKAVSSCDAISDFEQTFTVGPLSLGPIFTPGTSARCVACHASSPFIPWEATQRFAISCWPHLFSFRSVSSSPPPLLPYLSSPQNPPTLPSAVLRDPHRRMHRSAYEEAADSFGGRASALHAAGALGLHGLPD